MISNTRLIKRFILLASMLTFTNLLLTSKQVNLLNSSILPNKITLDKPFLIKPKIALVLSGGGARGLSQIGVLKEFERQGIKIDYIIGSSIGAIIGGLYASGYSADELDSIMKSIEWDELISLSEEQKRTDLFLDQKIISDRSIVTLHFKNFEFIYPEAIQVGTRLNLLIQKLFWNAIYKNNQSFDSLKYPFRAVSTDIVGGKSVVHKSGDLITAVRASITVPLRFSPVRLDSMILVDGGILANVPVQAALDFKPDIIIAVNTISPLYKIDNLNTPWNLADQVISMAMLHFSEESLKYADIVIEPALEDYRNDNFQNIQELIEIGSRSATEAIPIIKSLYKYKMDSIIQGNYNIELNSGNPKNIPSQIVFSGFFSEDSLLLMDNLTKGILTVDDSLINNILSLNDINLYDKIEITHNETNFRKKIVINATNFPLIKDIKILGASEEYKTFFDETIKSLFVGKIFSENIRQECIETINKEYRSRGFSFASVLSVFFDVQNNCLNIKLDEGRIKAIKIDGNEYISRFLIEREIEFKEGLPLTADAIIKSWENLISTEYFSDVKIEPLHDLRNEGIDVVLTVKELGNQSIKIGGRLDNERNAQLGVDLIQENIFFIGGRLNGRFAIGSRNQKLNLIFEIPRIWSTMLTFRTNTYFETRGIYEYRTKKGMPREKFMREKIGEYVEERYGIKASVGTQVEKIGRISAEYRFERQRTYDKSADDKPGYSLLSTIKFGALFDSENKSDFPTEGSLIKLSLESTFLGPGKTIGFSNINYEHRIYYSIGRHTLKPSIYFGFADITLPLPEFYSLGGESLFYGYRDDDFRGRQVFISSLEYRLRSPFDLFFDTYLSLRYDLGSIWEVPENIRFQSLKHGIGSSISFDTPLGPARFSAGKSFYFVKDPDGVVVGPLLFYFSIGMTL